MPTYYYIDRPNYGRIWGVEEGGRGGGGIGGGGGGGRGRKGGGRACRSTAPHNGCIYKSTVMEECK